MKTNQHPASEFAGMRARFAEVAEAEQKMRDDAAAELSTYMPSGGDEDESCAGRVILASDPAADFTPLGAFIAKTLAAHTLDLPGLPHGLRMVRYGKPQENELYLGMNDRLHRAGGDYPSALIVEVLPGWDIRYNVAFDNYEVFARYPKPRKLLATFEVKDSAEEDDATKALNAIPGLKALSSLP